MSNFITYVILAMVFLLTACVHSPTVPRPRGDCELLSSDTSSQSLATLYDDLEVPLVVTVAGVYRCHCWGRKLGGDTQMKVSDQRTIGGAVQGRQIGGANQSRNVGGMAERRKISGATQERAIGGAAQERAIGGATQERAIGGAAQERAIGGATQERFIRGAGRKVSCQPQNSCLYGYAVTGVR